MFVDTHCHYDMKQFDENRFQLLAQIKASGIEKIIVPSVFPESNDSMYKKLDFIRYPELLKNSGLTPRQLPQIFFAAGVHPSKVWSKTAIPESDWEEKIKFAAGASNTAAIGETGLDYHYPMDEFRIERQHAWFRRQIRISQELRLPLILHIRMADKDAVSILREYTLKKSGAVHCFSGGWETAKEYLNLGLMIGVGGSLTLSENSEMRAAVKNIPLESIILETDAPYVKPAWCGDEWNTSLNIPQIAQMIAGLKGVSAELVEKTTTENAEKLFGI